MFMDNHDACVVVLVAAAVVVQFAFFFLPFLFVLKREKPKESIGLLKQTPSVQALALVYIIREYYQLASEACIERHGGFRFCPSMPPSMINLLLLLQLCSLSSSSNSKSSVLSFSAGLFLLRVTTAAIIIDRQKNLDQITVLMAMEIDIVI